MYEPINLSSTDADDHHDEEHEEWMWATAIPAGLKGMWEFSQSVVEKVKSLMNLALILLHFTILLKERLFGILSEHIFQQNLCGESKFILQDPQDPERTSQ